MTLWILSAYMLLFAISNMIEMLCIRVWLASWSWGNRYEPNQTAFEGVVWSGAVFIRLLRDFFYLGEELQMQMSLFLPTILKWSFSSIWKTTFFISKQSFVEVVWVQIERSAFENFHLGKKRFWGALWIRPLIRVFTICSIWLFDAGLLISMC